MKSSQRSPQATLHDHGAPVRWLIGAVVCLAITVTVVGNTVAGDTVPADTVADDTVAANTATGQRWFETRRIDTFCVRTNFPIDEHEELFDELGRLRNDVSETLGVAATDHPVDLYLFGDRTSYEAFLHRRYPKVPFRRALFIKTAASHVVCAYRSDVLDVDLRHEATHALLHGALRRVPLWIDEGLAEYFEMAPAQRASRHPHLAALGDDPSLRVTPLAALEQKTKVAEMGRADYRDAWAWVHFMLHGPVPAHRSLVQFLSAIRRGTPPGQLSARLHSAVPQLREKMTQHFKHWRA
jgi:hypothetical protein